MAKVSFSWKQTETVTILIIGRVVYTWAVSQCGAAVMMSEHSLKQAYIYAFGGCLENLWNHVLMEAWKYLQNNWDLKISFFSSFFLQISKKKIASPFSI